MDNTTTTRPLTLDPDEAARAIGVSRATLYGLWSRGEGPRSFRIGKCRRVTIEAVHEWLRERESAAA